MTHTVKHDSCPVEGCDGEILEYEDGRKGCVLCLLRANSVLKQQVRALDAELSEAMKTNDAMLARADRMRWS